MSRLKGADLGVQVPTGTLNYRGKWSSSPSPAYASSDLVLRFGLPYVAMLAPGIADPAGGNVALGGNYLTAAAQGWSGQSSGQRFTVSSTVTVAGMKVQSSTSAGQVIASGTLLQIRDDADNVLATGSTSGTPALGAWVSVTFATPVTLAPGVTYRAYCGSPNWSAQPSPAQPSGVIATIGSNHLYGGAGDVTNNLLAFELDGNPWQSLLAAKTNQGTTLPAIPQDGSVYRPGDIFWKTDTKEYYVVTGAAGGTYTDSFNRADGAPGATEVGGLSYALTGAVAIASNQLSIPSSGAVALVVPDGAVDFTFDFVTQWGNSPRISWWFRGPNNRIFSVGDSSNDIGVTSGAANATTSPTFSGSQVGGWLAATLGPSAIGTWRLIYDPVAGVVSLYKNGALQITWTDPSFVASPSGTVSVGLYSSGPLTVDNLSLVAGGALHWERVSSVTENVNIVAASGAAVTLPDVTTATMHKVTLTAATPAITLPAPGAGKSFTVELVQDATGGRAPTWVTPSGAIRWPGSAAPTITATANGIDVITFVCIGGTNWYGFVAGQAFA